MPIFVDYNQVFLSTIFAFNKSNFNEVNESLIRHTVLSCALSYKRKYSEEYGNLIFCCDSHGNYWRKDIFKYYKASRKKYRDSTGLNWDDIYHSLNKIREEMLCYMPYKVIMLDTAEADDIIATLCKYIKEPILILSGDQDFIPLQCFKNVKQYAPIQKKWVRHDNPSVYLKEKILRGDVGDGIPNFLSDDDTFVNPDKRQTPLREKKLQVYLNTSVDTYDVKLQMNYKRNQTLIDLINFIPSDLESSIIKEFEEQHPTRKKIMSYFINNGLKLLMENLTEF
jgi:hypothetical protein